MRVGRGFGGEVGRGFGGEVGRGFGGEGEGGEVRMRLVHKRLGWDILGRNIFQ